MRRDGSARFPRDWVLEGCPPDRAADPASDPDRPSEDGWVALRVHREDRTVGVPGQLASWAVTGATVAGAARVSGKGSSGGGGDGWGANRRGGVGPRGGVPESRWLRLRLTGPNAGGGAGGADADAEAAHFHVSGVEFYGLLRERDAPG